MRQGVGFGERRSGVRLDTEQGYVRYGVGLG